VRVLSRDESKQYEMRKAMPDPRLSFQVGDVRCYSDMLKATKGVTHIIHAAAMKHVPTCEYEPLEAVRTNINGTANVIRAATVREVRSVVGISTDKACNPSCVMGMTKAVMERMLVEANLHTDKTSFNAVRFGNVVPSRGSVVPLFLEKIKKGEPLTVTNKNMTRFLFSVKDAAHDAILAAQMTTRRGTIYVRKLKSAYITDVARVLIGERNIPITYTGTRPGEKLSEELVSEEEASHSEDGGDYLVILPLLRELEIAPRAHFAALYSSRYPLMTLPELREMLKRALGEEWPNGD
jgi:UDP-glucose 4-epimerase